MSLKPFDFHWVNTCYRLPDYDKEVYVLVVDSRGGNIEYARAKLSKAGWAFTTKAPYSKIVAWIEPDNVFLSGGDLACAKGYAQVLTMLSLFRRITGRRCALEIRNMKKETDK